MLETVGGGPEQLSVREVPEPAADDGAVIVSTPQDLSLIDARRAVDLFNKMSVPVLGIIENMAIYACPHCGEASHPFGGAEFQLRPQNLGREGYVETEHLVSGNANVYTWTQPGPATVRS